METISSLSSCLPQSLIEKGKGYGVYHVNFDSKAVQQLMLNFSSSVLENSNEGEDKACLLYTSSLLLASLQQS